MVYASRPNGRGRNVIELGDFYLGNPSSMVIYIYDLTGK